jgi:hypothetical protein
MKIESAYGLTVPGETPYSSQQARSAISIEMPVAGEGSVSEILSTLNNLQDQLDAALKTNVCLSLGLNVTNNDGVLQPDWTDVPTQAQRETTSAPSSSSGGGRSRSHTHTVILNGNQVEVEDLRPLKAAGKFKPTAPDFRVEGNGVWLKGKNGQFNADAKSIADQIEKLEAVY